jgi:hypothetical protein
VQAQVTDNTDISSVSINDGSKALLFRKASGTLNKLNEVSVPTLQTSKKNLPVFSKFHQRRAPVLAKVLSKDFEEDNLNNSENLGSIMQNSELYAGGEKTRHISKREKIVKLYSKLV